MIQIFLGSDRFSRQQALQQAVDEALGSQKDDPMARQTYHAGESNNDALVARIIESCSMVSMFGPQQAVILRKMDALKTAESSELASWIKTQPDCLFFGDGDKLDGRSELAKALKKHGEVKTFEAPKAYKMAEWVVQHCRTVFQLGIEPTAAQYLSDALGPDPALVHAEIEKLKLHSPDCQTLSLTLVKDLVVPQREMAAYEIQKPFGDRNQVAFVRTLRHLLERGISGTALVWSLHQQALRMFHVQSMSRQGKSADEMAKVCGMMPFVFSKTANIPAQAKKWPTPLLIRVLHRLTDISFDMKYGKYASQAELEMALCALIVR